MSLRLGGFSSAFLRCALGVFTGTQKEEFFQGPIEYGNALFQEPFVLKRGRR
jgi:hypothetical protein